jgi:hypothetical protein
MKRFSQVYKRFCDSRGITAYKAAPLVGVSVATSYLYFCGQSLPPASRIPLLAERLGVSAKRLQEVVTAERAKNRKSGSKGRP